MAGLVLSVGIAVVFTLIRLAISAVTGGAAIGGLIAAGAAAALALLDRSRRADNFVPGLLTNARLRHGVPRLRDRRLAAHRPRRRTGS